MLLTDFELLPTEGSCLNKQVTVCRNHSSEKDGKILYISPVSTLHGFLKDAERKLGMETEAAKLYTPDGEYIDDVIFINDEDILFVLDKYEEFEAKRNNELGSFVLGDFIGQGSFGKVHFGTHKRTAEVVALKFMDKDQLGSLHDAERVFTEVQCLNTLDHPNVIKLLEVLNTPMCVVLAFEYAAGGDLGEYVRSKPGHCLTERDAARLFIQILDGVAYCHHHHVVHYDLKPENILLVPKLEKQDAFESNGPDSHVQYLSKGGIFVVKIADFGLSQVCRPGQLSKNYHAGSLVRQTYLC